jgi:hypothetical protein
MFYNARLIFLLYSKKHINISKKRKRFCMKQQKERSWEIFRIHFQAFVARKSDKDFLTYIASRHKHHILKGKLRIKTFLRHSRLRAQNVELPCIVVLIRSI